MEVKQTTQLLKSTRKMNGTVENEYVRTIIVEPKATGTLEDDKIDQSLSVRAYAKIYFTQGEMLEGGQMVDYKKLTRASGRWSIEDSSYLCRERKIVAKSKGWNLQTRNFENLSITKNPSDNAGADFTTPNFGPIDFESNLMGVIGVETDATICRKTNQSSTWRLNLILVMGNQVNWS